MSLRIRCRHILSLPRLYSTTPRGIRPARKPSPFDVLGKNLTAEALGPASSARAVIDALGPTSFTISGVRVSGAVLVMPHFSTLWNIDRFDRIEPSAFALIKLITPRPDVVFIGTGVQLLPLAPELRTWFRELGVSVESMDTKNACHTFNVLNEEARNVAAALLPAGYCPGEETGK